MRAGRPRGNAAPNASRSRAASSAAARRVSPAMTTSIPDAARAVRQRVDGVGIDLAAGVELESGSAGRAIAARSCTSSASRARTTVGEALQLELEIGQHRRVEQLAQLFGSEQVAQQLAVERQRRRPPLGQGRVTFVHIDGDPTEQQRLRKRRSPRCVDRAPCARGALADRRATA